MEPWVIQQFGALEPVREQTIVKIVNRLTLESALFNPLRARRPDQAGRRRSGAGGVDRARAGRARYLSRPRARHDRRCVRAHSRAALCDRLERGEVCRLAWAGDLRRAAPAALRPGSAARLSGCRAALAGGRACLRPQAIYPMITWNCLPKSGATMMHGHMQIALTRGMHYTHVERWRRAAEEYRARDGRKLFRRSVCAARRAGAGDSLGAETRAFAHLTPARNREIVFLADAAQTSETRRWGDKESIYSVSPSPCHPV